MNNLTRFLMCCCLVVAGGCGSGGSGPKLVPAKGEVKYQGKPLAGARVMFAPDKGPVAIGETDLEGKFTLNSGALRGVAVGPATVTVTAVPPSSESSDLSAISKQPQTPEESAAYMKKAAEMQRDIAAGKGPIAQAKSLIPDKYGRADSSGLKFEVKDSGDNDFKIELN